MATVLDHVAEDAAKRELSYVEFLGCLLNYYMSSKHNEPSRVKPFLNVTSASSGV